MLNDQIQSNKVQLICMTSSIAFSMASVVYGWLAPISTLLGFMPDSVLPYIDNKNIKKQLDDAINKALSETEKNMPSESKKKIIQELRNTNAQPDNFNMLIEKTEEYQKQYYTNKDKQEIIKAFDVNLRNEILHNDTLSHLYILSSGFATLEKLKQINEINIATDKKIDEIKEDIKDIKKNIGSMSKIFICCANEITFILIAVAVFFGFGKIFHCFFNEHMSIVVPVVCFALSDVLNNCMNKKEHFF